MAFVESPARPMAASTAVLAAAAAFAIAVAIQTGDAHSEADRLAASALFSSAMFALLALAGALMSRRSIGDALGLGPGVLSGRDVTCMALGAVGLSHAADALLRATGLIDGSVLEQLNATMQGSRGATLAGLLLGLALAPAIAEELLCRGLLLRGVRRHFGTAAALLISSLLFAVLHMDLAQGLFALVLGFYLAIVALLTGSTRAPIFAHLLNNTGSVLGAAFELESGPGLHLAALLATALGLHALLRAGRAGRAQQQRDARAAAAANPG